jgi:hypothetical protein
MGPIRDLKGVQKIMGCLAALSHFISRLNEKALPLYCLLKKSEHFLWTLDAKEALTRLKATLTKPLILAPLTIGESLLHYVTVTTQVVSGAIVVERRRRVTRCPFRDQYTSSVKCSQTPRCATRKSRSCCMSSC